MRRPQYMPVMVVAALLPVCLQAGDPASVAAELRTIQRAIATGELPTIPESWNVETPERKFQIPSATLRDLLTPPRTNLRRDQAQRWLNHLATQLESASTDPPGPANPRATLDRILQQPMFSGIRPPNAWEQFRRRVTAWIQEQLARLFHIVAEHPTGGYILFWLVVAAVGGTLAVWLVGFWGRESEVPGVSTVEAGPRNRTRYQWLKAARDAADHGDARLAIHCAYWAGIAHLEDTGSLPAEQARTPRELLRLAAAGPALALREPLGALTAKLERFWYAGHAAGIEDYRESLKHLDALGCKVE